MIKKLCIINGLSKIGKTTQVMMLHLELLGLGKNVYNYGDFNNQFDLCTAEYTVFDGCKYLDECLLDLPNYNPTVYPFDKLQELKSKFGQFDIKIISIIGSDFVKDEINSQLQDWYYNFNNMIHTRPIQNETVFVEKQDKILTVNEKIKKIVLT
jgi:hypothetical protein